MLENLVSGEERAPGCGRSAPTVLFEGGLPLGQARLRWNVFDVQENDLPVSAFFRPDRC